MLMSPLWAPGCNEDETAVHRRRIRSGEMAVRMRKVLFIPVELVVCASLPNLVKYLR